MAQLTKTALAFLLVCAAPPVFRSSGADETIRTPSDQMKEAVGKVGKAPATLGKSLQDLTEAAKEKLRQTFGATPSPDSKDKPADVSMPKKSAAPTAPVRMNEAHRDPFRPTTLRTKSAPSAKKRENLSPLERLELSQLKLVGIVWDIKDPRAMVEDGSGLGYVISVGTPIGANDGKVKAIHRNEVIVEEFYSDDFGARKRRDVGMKLMTE